MAAKKAIKRVRGDDNHVAENQRLTIYTGLLAVFTFLLVIVGLLQWCTLDKTDKAFRAVQRAFITSDLKLTPVRDGDGKLQYWRLELLLENSGATPTRNMRWITEPSYGPKIDPEAEEIPVSMMGSASAFLGPKGKFAFWDAIVDRTAEERIIKGEALFIIGKATYFDTLSSSESHTTKFCFQVYGAPWRPDTPVQAIDMLIDRVDLSFNMCRHNNCADRECNE